MGSFYQHELYKIKGVPITKYAKDWRPNSTEQGVYIIYDPKGEVVHVGRSVRGRNGLYQRLRNHLRGNSSFTKQFLNGDGSKLRSGYKYKYKVIPNPRTRALLEALATGRLCPKHLGLGDKSQ